MNEFKRFEDRLTGLIESLSPSGRRRLSAELAKRLRQSQQRRVMAQKAGRSPRRKAAPVAVRAANYVDVITKIAPQLRGFIYGRCGRYVDSG